MQIITIRTDKPEAELGLYADRQQIYYIRWQAHRQLAETIHNKINTLLTVNQTTFKDIEAIVLFKGPGSFTGLRIGAAVANALAKSLGVPIVGAQSDNWCDQGVTAIMQGGNDIQVIPEYGAPVHITAPKH